VALRDLYRPLQDAGMDVCAVLIDKLKQHPELTYVEFPGGVHIGPPSPTGFAVELRSVGKRWMVHLGNAGFHEEFFSGEEALQFVAWCYSGLARLREVWRGGTPQEARLEAYEDEKWSWISKTGSIFVPLWRQRYEVLLENPALLTE
jgi:hypothetical protein